MATLALVLAALASAALLALDVLFIRRTERALAELEKQQKDEDWTKPAPEKAVPTALTAARVLGPVFGWLNFPATLAPVILVALTSQRFGFITDGYAALLAIFVAGLSMSTSLKAMRMGEYLDAAKPHYLTSIRQCIAYILGWTVLVLGLLSAAEPTTPVVMRVVLTYVILLVGFSLFLVRVHKNAPKWLEAEASK
ncbi:MAG: hypothetical protein AAF411_11600 [Myxococcota bacterium]